jgi:hypothetical protein
MEGRDDADNWGTSFTVACTNFGSVTVVCEVCSLRSVCHLFPAMYEQNLCDHKFEDNLNLVALVTLWLTTRGSDLHQQETKMLVPVSDCWMLSIYKVSFSWHQNYTENNRKLRRAWRWWYFCRDSTLASFIGCHLEETWDMFLCNSRYKIYWSHCLFCTTCPFFLSLLHEGLS